jgi:hypothetical protein
MFSVSDFKSNPKQNLVKTNLFSVKFSGIPTMTEQEIQILEYMTQETTIPGTNKNWHISVLLNDLNIYDAFREWARQTAVERVRMEQNDPQAWSKSLGELELHLLCVSALLTIFDNEGEPLKVYKIMGIEIEDVSNIDLSWTVDPERTPTYNVHFRIDACEPQPATV